MNESYADPAPRALGAFDVSNDVRAVLAQLRHRSGVTGRAEVDADRLHAIEVGVVFRFPDDILALWAADVPVLRDGHALSLNKVVAHMGALRECGARGDLIGLGRVGDDGHLCIEKRTAQVQGEGARAGGPELTVYDAFRRTLRTMSLVAWLGEVCDTVPAVSGDAPAFAPSLSRVLPGGSSGARVRHATFGEGRVFVEIGDGPTRKVKVEFARHGLKMLQARFLEYLDD